MEFLNKIENFINQMLIKLGELIVRTILRLIPQKVKIFWAKFVAFLKFCVANIKRLPSIVLTWLKNFLLQTKNDLLSFDYKGKFKEAYNSAMAEYKKRYPNGGGSSFKKLMLTPFLIMSEWLR